MAWTLTGDLKAFLAAAGGFLTASPARNTVLLSVTARLRSTGRARGEPPPEFGWWRGPDGVVEGACMRTAPRPLVLSPMPEEAADALAGILADSARHTAAEQGGAPPTMVSGGCGSLDLFAGAWERRTGARPRIEARHRLYRLDVPGRPPDVPGRPRPATVGDRALLITWFDAFGRDTGSGMGDPARAVDERLGQGGITVWEDGDGLPVSCAGATLAVAGMVRIAPVYTPDERRGRGYAAAVTSAVGRAALAAGIPHVVLFADADAPVPNALYQRIGYRPVEDHRVLSCPAEPVATAAGMRSQGAAVDSADNGKGDAAPADASPVDHTLEVP